MEHRQHLFLIFKEAINNAITHSNCTELILNANVNGKILKMTLKDNGDGFDTVIQSHGNGLENMKDRASKIGGKLAINSEKGNGTVVNYFGYIH
jgi:signal transduction histidine kinase